MPPKNDPNKQPETGSPVKRKASEISATVLVPVPPLASPSALTKEKLTNLMLAAIRLSLDKDLSLNEVTLFIRELRQHGIPVDEYLVAQLLDCTMLKFMLTVFPVLYQGNVQFNPENCKLLEFQSPEFQKDFSERSVSLHFSVYNDRSTSTGTAKLMMEAEAKAKGQKKDNKQFPHTQCVGIGVKSVPGSPTRVDLIYGSNASTYGSNAGNVCFQLEHLTPEKQLMLCLAVVFGNYREDMDLRTVGGNKPTLRAALSEGDSASSASSDELTAVDALLSLSGAT